jgi:chemotaxis protein MotA
MDLASLIGILIALVGVFVGAILKGADPVVLFTNVPALMIVFLGTIGVVWQSHTMKENLAALKAILKVYLPGPPPDAKAIVDKLVAYAGTARTEGMLGLEQKAKEEEDPFLAKALTLAADGADPAVIRDTLKFEISAMKERHRTCANWHQSAGVFSPTLGIVGAVVGLIAVMAKLDDPSSLGHGIAAAFVATFWGVFLANGLFLPWANKLKRLSAQEVACKNLVVDGVLGILAGTSPRVMGEKLEGYFPQRARQAS